MAGSTVTIDIPGIGNVVANNAASEATLKEILKAIQGGEGGGYKKGGKPGDAKNKEYKDEAGGGGKGKDGDKEGPGLAARAGKAIGSILRPAQMVAGGFFALGQQSASLINAFANVGDTFSGAASVFSSVPVFGPIFAAVAGAADKVLGSYQSMTASGATFGNSINNFAAASSGAGLTMEKFGRIIAQNGDAMQMLGGTTENGANQFARMSKELRNSQIGQQMLGLGMTTEQVNQGMASYIKIAGQGGALQGKSAKELAAGAGAYLKELDALAKVTGQSRESAQKDMEQRAKDAQFLAATAKMDPTARAELNAFIQTFPKESQEAIKDMITTGNITSDAAIEFNAQMGGTSQEIMKIGQQVREQGKFNKQSGDEALKYATREAKIRQQTQEYQTLGLYGGTQWAKSTAAIAELAGRDVNGKEKALSAQEKAAAAQAAAMEKAKQDLAAWSNSFQMALANSGLLNLMLEAFQWAAGIVMNYVVPAFNLFTDIVVGLSNFLIETFTPVFKAVGEFIRDTVYPALLYLAGVIVVDVLPMLQAIGEVIVDYVWPALKWLGGIINDYVLPVFVEMGKFIINNLTPILLGLATALGAYGLYLAGTTVAGWLNVAAQYANLPALLGLAAAAWSAVAPILAIVAPIVALVGLFIYLYKTGWSFGDILEALGDNLKRFALNYVDMWLWIAQKVAWLFGGSDLIDQARENIQAQREELDEREKLRDQRREARAAERADDKKEEERKKVGGDLDKKLMNLKFGHNAGLQQANADQKAAIEEKKGLDKDYDNTLNLLQQQAAQQNSGLIQTPKTNVAGAEGARQTMTDEATRKAEAEKKAKEDAAAKQNGPGSAGPGQTAPAPATQESPATLLASLNTKMDQLIKINKSHQEIGDQQLGALRGMSQDLYS